MAKEDGLTRLRDIHLPDPISWWPLAPGWYMVMMLGVFFVIFLVYLDHRRRLHARAKNQALELLQRYKQEYEKENNSQITSARISELLKRVALVYFPRVEVASMHGTTWIDFLNKTSKGIDFKPVQSMLLESPFKPSEPLNLKPLITRSEQWIKQRRIPCSN